MHLMGHSMLYLECSRSYSHADGQVAISSMPWNNVASTAWRHVSDVQPMASLPDKYDSEVACMDL